MSEQIWHLWLALGLCILINPCAATQPTADYIEPNRTCTEAGSAHSPGRAWPAIVL
jgi:hypothetical protein